MSNFRSKLLYFLSLIFLFISCNPTEVACNINNDGCLEEISYIYTVEVVADPLGSPGSFGAGSFVPGSSVSGAISTTTLGVFGTFPAGLGPIAPAGVFVMIDNAPFGYHFESIDIYDADFNNLGNFPIPDGYYAYQYADSRYMVSHPTVAFALSSAGTYYVNLNGSFTPSPDPLIPFFAKCGHLITNISELVGVADVELQCDGLIDADLVGINISSLDLHIVSVYNSTITAPTFMAGVTNVSGYINFETSGITSLLGLEDLVSVDGIPLGGGSYVAPAIIPDLDFADKLASTHSACVADPTWLLFYDGGPHPPIDKAKICL